MSRVIPPIVITCMLAVGSFAHPSDSMAYPSEAEQNKFVAVARGSGFPGDDYTVFSAGVLACQDTDAHRPRQVIVNDLVYQYGASSQAASSAIAAAQGILCRSLREG